MSEQLYDLMVERGHELVLSDCVDSSSPIELFSVEKQKDRLILANESLIDETKSVIQQSVGWLPFFAEKYNISSELKDYVMIPVVIMPSDLPNRNAQAFPFKELVRADIETGLLGFETWSRKPTFIDHLNKNHTVAKGIILSSVMKPIKNSQGKLWKVLTLLAFDRKKDPILANDILTGKRTNYSMGAWSKYFTCSLCQAQHTSQNQGCEHINLKMPRIKRTIDNKLIYLQAREINGFETSSVLNPAYFSSTTPTNLHLHT